MGDMGDMGDMGPEIEPEMGDEVGVEIEEPKEGYQNVMDSIFSESKIDKLFFSNFNKFWNESLTKNYSCGLFVFIMKHRKHLFYYKKRRLPLLAAIKHSFLFAFRRC